MGGPMALNWQVVSATAIAVVGLLGPTVCAVSFKMKQKRIRSRTVFLNFIAGKIIKNNSYKVVLSQR